MGTWIRCMVVVGVVATMAGAHAERPVSLYVSTSGNDAWSGTLREPFATPERARDELRRLKKEGRLAEGARVYFRGGTYPRTACFALDERDSGAEGGEIVYRPFRNEQVRLTGARELAPAAFRPVTDPAILARLPEESRGKVLQVDLRAEGITDLGEMRPRGFARPYTNPGLELFCDDQPLTLARWPNDGVVPIGEVLDRGSVPRDADLSNRGALFRYDYDRAERWKQANDVWLSGLFCYGFADDTLKAETIDTEARTIKLAQPHIYGVSSRAAWSAYYVLNLLEEIDRPGEYYVDRSTGLLYVWPPGPAGARFAVSVLDEPLVAMEGVSHVTLRDLALEMTRGMGVYIERGTGNRIAGCIVRNTGNVGICFGQGVKAVPQQMRWGIASEKGEPLPPAEFVSRDLGALQDYIYADTVWNRNAGTDHSVVGCDIYNTGAGGVVLSGGDRRSLTPGRNSVRNCDIHHFSRLDRAYRAAVWVDGVGNIIAHNLMHDAPHNAILLHGNDHLIEYNEIHHVCRNADDMGAFYMGRDCSEQGIVLRYNYFHDNGNGEGATCSVYFDDGSCGATVYGNVFHRQIGSPIWINGGHDHTFANNLFVDCGGVTISSGLDNAAWANYTRDPLQVRRLRESLDITQPPYSTRYPLLADTFNDDPGYPRGQTVSRNVLVRSGELSMGEGNLSISDDPGFVDAAGGDLGLRSDSMVFAKAPGFAPIPFGDIGLHADAYRHTLPGRAVPEVAQRPERDPRTRDFAADLSILEAGALPGQGGWARFGPGPDVQVQRDQTLPVASTQRTYLKPVGRAMGWGRAGFAVANGNDSWASIDHGIILDGSRDITLEIEAMLPAPLSGRSFLEVYLNRQATWADGQFGVSLQGGVEEGVPDSICVRQDGQRGPRVLADDRLLADHWYRLRLTIPAHTHNAAVTVMDLTAGERAFRPARFAGEEVLGITQGEHWSPPLDELDSLVLRLGDAALVARLSLENR